MRSLSYVVLLLTLLFLGVFSPAQQTPAAPVPNLIRYGGMLKNGQGTALPETTVGVTFAIYKQQEGGAPVWLETQNVIPDATGRYSVLLGSTAATGLPSDLFSAQEERWLGIQVQGQAEQPRVLLVSVPYAMKAAEADTLAGHSASEFVTTDTLQTAVKEQVQQQIGQPTSSRATAVGVSPNQNTSPYINNGTVLQSGADFNIDGNGTAATLNATSNYNLGGTPVLGNSGTQGMFLGAGAGQNNTGSYNLFLGIAAGHNTTAADYNTFIGTDAGYFNTTGTQNFMLGATAGYHNTTGSYNMFVGSLAGYNNTTGTRNVFVGRAAGSGNTTGTGNSFFGANAGSASTANFNTFLGGFSGTATTTGTQNTFVGWQAGQTNVTGSNNLILGYNAGSAGGTTSNNDIYIASPGAANETGVIRIGAPTSQTAAYMAGIYGNAPSGALPVVVNASGQLGTTTAGIGVTSFNGRSGAVVPAANDYSFSLLSGTLQASQLSGTYGSAVTLSSTSNVFYGNGANLTGITTSSGSPYYIQNGTSLQTGANFNIGGIGSANSFNSTTSYEIGGSSVLSIGSSADFNVFLGVGAGANDVAGSGSGNVFSGYLAGYLNTTGFDNAFYGNQVGYFNTTGGENTFIGDIAGAANTTGGFNTYVGSAAGGSADGGNNNTFLGAHAGYDGGGSGNTFLGFSAGSYTAPGNNNTFTGIRAGWEMDGSYNTAYGYNAGSNPSYGNNDIYIANVGPPCPPTCAETSTIRIGGDVGSGYGAQTATYIAGISGAATTSGVPVFIDSTGKLGTSGGSLGSVTSFNGRTGAVVPAANDYSFSQISGTLGGTQLGGAYTSAVTLNNASNSFAGSFAGNGVGLIGVLPAGGSANYVQNGTSTQTAASFNIDGSGTVGGALSANVVNANNGYTLSGTPVLSGDASNLFVGDFAGQAGPSGSANTFVGSEAGQFTTTGGSNTFVGNLSGYSNVSGGNNTFVGYNSGGQNTTGFQNTYVGYLSGVNGIGVGDNTFVGHRAGFNNTSGGSNIFLGWSAGVNNVSGSNDIYIASDGPGSGTESNTIRIGIPAAQTAAYIQGISGTNIGSGSTVYVSNGGQLGTLTSSRRFKEQIRDMGDSTNGLMKLRPVTFLYKPEYDKGPRTLQYGLIAEEVAEVYPDLVAYDPEGKPYTVKYQYLATMLLNEMQKQYHRAEAQAEVIKAQEQNMKTQQQEIERLKAQLKPQNATFEDRLSRLESMVETQMRTATRKAPQATMAADGGLQ